MNLSITDAVLLIIMIVGFLSALEWVRRRGEKQTERDEDQNIKRWF